MGKFVLKNLLQTGLIDRSQIWYGYLTDICGDVTGGFVLPQSDFISNQVSLIFQTCFHQVSTKRGEGYTSITFSLFTSIFFNFPLSKLGFFWSHENTSTQNATLKENYTLDHYLLPIYIRKVNIVLEAVILQKLFVQNPNLACLRLIKKLSSSWKFIVSFQGVLKVVFSVKNLKNPYLTQFLMHPLLSQFQYQIWQGLTHVAM